MDTFATLINRKLIVASQKTSYLAIERGFLVQVMLASVARIPIDERWYLSNSPDVAEAIVRGDFDSAADHYRRVGFYEHRMPYQIEVDEPWYLESYLDVASAVQNGVFVSGKEHYYLQGFREGRFPYANFSLHTADHRTPQAELRSRGRNVTAVPAASSV